MNVSISAMYMFLFFIFFPHLEQKVALSASSIADVSNNLQHTVKDIEEKDWGNKLKKALDSQ